MDDRFSASEPCRLHLDILELILQEHRNDQVTLASSALASPTLLPIARKLLYRSISLDYCENPYGYEQQRKLRSSLSSYPWLCGYIKTLRLSLNQESRYDVELRRILRALGRLETLHVIGGGIGTEVWGATGAGIGIGSRSGDGDDGTLDGALKKAFALPSLRKVTLDNIYPLSDMYVSYFTELKHLELLSVGGGPPVSMDSTSTLQLQAPPSVADSISRNYSASSVSTHTRSPSPSPLSPSPSPTSNAASSPWYLGLSTGQEQRMDRHGIELGVVEAPPSSLSSARMDSSQVSPSPSASSASSGNYGYQDTTPTTRNALQPLSSSTTGSSISTIATASSSYSGGNGNGRRSKRKVRLEYLVLNLEHLRPILDVICRDAIPHGPAQRGKGKMLAAEEMEMEEEEEGTRATLDFSGLKQAHIYVWDPDDGDGIWTILHSARKSLERLTLRYFQYGDTYSAYHTGFDNLHSLVLGTHTFSIKEDPFRSMLQFFKDASTKLPSLRKVKISFDLWGCESSGTSWTEVSGYRGWRELDGTFAAFKSVSTSASDRLHASLPNGTSTLHPSQLTSIVFEVWCSSSYKKASSSCRGGSSGERDLLTLIRDELSYLRQNPNFILI